MLGGCEVWGSGVGRRARPTLTITHGDSIRCLCFGVHPTMTFRLSRGLIALETCTRAYPKSKSFWCSVPKHTPNVLSKSAHKKILSSQINQQSRALQVPNGSQKTLRRGDASENLAEAVNKLCVELDRVTKDR